MISAWLITFSAQLRPAAHSSAQQRQLSTAAPCSAVPWRALPCPGVRCCAVLSRGECFAVLTRILLHHN